VKEVDVIGIRYVCYLHRCARVMFDRCRRISPVVDGECKVFASGMAGSHMASASTDVVQESSDSNIEGEWCVPFPMGADMLLFVTARMSTYIWGGRSGSST
jgi:hypothetical protein